MSTFKVPFDFLEHLMKIQNTRILLLIFTLAFPILVLTYSNNATASRGEISLSGKTILRDGAPWIPQGVILTTFVNPKGIKGKKAFLKARSLYGDRQFKQLEAFGVDVLRIHVSQATVDPTSPIYDAEYFDDYKKGVNAARAKGFTVIVSMQWEATTGLSGQPKMPSDITTRAWEKVASVFANDMGVMYEVFNEPALKEQTPMNWAIWKDTHQRLINKIRQAGAKNVLIVEGLRIGHYLANSPALSDPLNKLVYGVHPFLNRETLTRVDWERDWGRFSNTHPVIVTAFDAQSKSPYCKPDMPQVVANLLSYLREKRIGIIFWAFDISGSIFENVNSRTLTNYNNFSCEQPRKGIGQFAYDYFQSHR